MNWIMKEYGESIIIIILGLALVSLFAMTISAFSSI